MLHLAGHALAKGGLFLTADGVLSLRLADTRFFIPICCDAVPGCLVWVRLFAAMSLAAMPPQAGFVSEWYVFQTVFQGFRLDTLAGRLVMALAGAGLALTVAVAFATFVKVFGLGCSGDRCARSPQYRRGTRPLLDYSD